jgi:hypothetical protein
VGSGSSSKLRAGTGLSKGKDSFQSGQEAATAALHALQGDAPALVFVFATPRYDLSALLAGVRSVTGRAVLIGASGSGEIVQGTYMGFQEGVGVCAMTAGPYRFGVASASHIRGQLDGAAQAITRASREAAGDSPHAMAFLLTDSLLGDLQQFFQGVYRVTGPKVSLIGAGAGDEQKFIRTVVFHDDAVVDEGALVLWIASPKPLQGASLHGWQPIGVPLIVTRAEGTEIVELGGRPAALAYEEQIGLAPGQLSSEDFWGTSILHPFGLIQPDGSTVIRVARAKSPLGALKIQGCVPPTGSAVQVMAGTVDSLMAISPQIVRETLDAKPEAGVVLTFSCAARATIFGKRVAEEARLLQEAASGTPTFGFYCCAEFARTSGVLGTHNATLTAFAL